MKNLIIVGARGFGREVYASIMNSKDVKDGNIKIKGFLDSKTDAFEGLRGHYPPILCSPEKYRVQSDDIFFIAMGESKWRKYYAELIESKGGHFYTYVAEGSFINETSKIGEGCYISRWCSISDNVNVGKHVIIHSFSNIGHDAIIKNYATILTNVFIGGCAEIGECSQMSPKSMIIPHKKVGKNAMVCAASVVMRNVKDNTSVIGNPAKKIDF